MNEIEEVTRFQCIHICDNTPDRVEIQEVVTANSNGRIPWTKYCSNCGELKPEYINEEAKEKNKLTWYPCECGAVAKIENDFMCLNPPCKYYGKKAR